MQSVFVLLVGFGILPNCLHPVVLALHVHDFLKVTFLLIWGGKDMKAILNKKLIKRTWNLGGRLQANTY
jgi:hypothetical protein